MKHSFRYKRHMNQVSIYNYSKLSRQFCNMLTDDFGGKVSLEGSIEKISVANGSPAARALCVNVQSCVCMFIRNAWACVCMGVGVYMDACVDLKIFVTTYSNVQQLKL